MLTLHLLKSAQSQLGTVFGWSRIMNSGKSAYISVLKSLVLLLCFFLFWPLPVEAQEFNPDLVQDQFENDTMEETEFDEIKTNITTIAKYLNARPFDLVDTSLRFFHQYNEPHFFDHFYENLGYYGSAVTPLFFKGRQENGFDLGFNAFDIYTKKPEEVRFFESFTPYTELFYVQGANEMQRFQVRHQRNIRPGWNFGVNFNRMISQGFYFRQRALVQNINFNNRYRTRNFRYQLFFTVLGNRQETQENGGIVDLNSFRSFDVGARERAEMNLQNLDHETRRTDVHLTQLYRLGNVESDTIITDEGDTGVFRSVKGRFHLIHQFNYRNHQTLYRDDNPNFGFYSPTRYDSGAMLDSVRYRAIENRFYFAKLPLMFGDSAVSIEKSTTLKAGVKHHLVFVDQSNPGALEAPAHDSLINDLHLLGEVNFRYGRWEVDASADIVALGTNIGNYLFRQKVNSLFGEQHEVSFHATQKLNNPTYLQTFMDAQFLGWNNDFSPQMEEEVGGRYFHRKWRTGFDFSASRIANYIYHDQSINPRQAGGDVLYAKASFKNHWTFWNKWHLENHLMYQWTDREDILRLPDFAGRHLTYFQSDLFDGALTLQAGIELRWFSTYFADAFYPVYGIFHLQDEKDIGNYPFVDVFVNARIQRFRFFLRMEHVNQGLTGYQYFTVPNQPFDPRVFKFGLGWFFFD